MSCYGGTHRYERYDNRTDRQLNTLAIRYHETFTQISANSPELKYECFRLRYQVYCLERGFEDAASRPGAIECDVYDDCSEHALLLHRASGVIVGTARLVVPALGMPAGSLPFHSVCDDPRAHDPEFLPPTYTAEVSRFAISKERTQLAFEKAARRGAQPADREARGMTVLGLLKAVLEMAVSKGIRYLCTIMEPALLRRLGLFGIDFKPIGNIVEHHGRRQPSYADIATLLEGIKAQSVEIWNLLTNHGLFSVADEEDPTLDRNMMCAPLCFPVRHFAS